MCAYHWRLAPADVQAAVYRHYRAGQRDDGNYAGSWDPDSQWGRDGGRVYATALGALTLESYYAYTRLLVR